jgi:hypothetical protein
MIDLLERREKCEEEALRGDRLTLVSAEQLCHDAAGVIRALLDLKDL